MHPQVNCYNFWSLKMGCGYNKNLKCGTDFGIVLWEDVEML